MVGLPKTRRPGSGETNSKGFTYYWSSMNNSHHIKEVATGISSISDADGQMARWAEHIEHLFTVDPPTGQLQTAGLQILDADQPIDETAAFRCRGYSR